jgi:poly(3-hydroxybutyrate) depolymerase
MLDAGSTRVPVTMDGGPAPAEPRATCPPTSTLEPGNTNDAIDVDGTRRTYVVHVPASYTGDMAMPVLIDLHGLFGTGQGQLRGSGTAAVADREGFIAVYPDGIDNAWNIGPCCTHDRGVDDVGFLRALVEKLQTEVCIDATRVYATGVSMGGGMSHYLACEAAETFAAVAPAAFDLLEENTCAPVRPISVLSARGTSDAIVPHSGGASTPPNGVPTTIHFRGAQGTFQESARIKACNVSPGGSYDGCESYTECQGDVEVTLCTEQGGRHTYGDPERAWQMLSKYSLP